MHKLLAWILGSCSTMSCVDLFAPKPAPGCPETAPCVDSHPTEMQAENEEQVERTDENHIERESCDYRDESSAMDVDVDWAKKWVAEVDANMMDTSSDKVTPQIDFSLPDWDNVISTIMDVLVKSIKPKCQFRQQVGVLRGVSKSWYIAASASVNSVHAHRTEPSTVAAALQTTFTRASCLVLKDCKGGISSKLTDVILKIGRLKALEILPVTLSWTHKHQRQLVQLGTLTSLHKLRLWGAIGITAEGICHLSGLRSLTHLSLGSRLYLSGEDCYALLPLKSLKRIELEGCTSMGDTGLRAIGELKQLTKINVGVYSGTMDYAEQISGMGLKRVCALSGLRKLSLRGCGTLTDSDLVVLSTLASLQSLRMEVCSKVTDRGLQSVGCITSLSQLTVKGCFEVSNQGIKGLSNLLNLKSIALGCCGKVTDDAVPTLISMPNLRDLVLCHCPLLTDKGLIALACAHNIHNFRLQGVGTGISGNSILELSLHDFRVDCQAWEFHIVKVEASGRMGS